MFKCGNIYIEIPKTDANIEIIKQVLDTLKGPIKGESASLEMIDEDNEEEAPKIGKGRPFRKDKEEIIAKIIKFLESSDKPKSSLELLKKFPEMKCRSITLKWLCELRDKQKIAGNKVGRNLFWTAITKPKKVTNDTLGREGSEETGNEPDPVDRQKDIQIGYVSRRNSAVLEIVSSKGPITIREIHKEHLTNLGYMEVYNSLKFLLDGEKIRKVQAGSNKFSYVVGKEEPKDPKPSEELQETVEEVSPKLKGPGLKEDEIKFKPKLKYNKCPKCKKANVVKLGAGRFQCPSCKTNFVIMEHVLQALP